MPEGKGTYGSKVGRPPKKKNPGDVQRESASKRKQKELKNKSKWKSVSPPSRVKPKKNWMERRMDLFQTPWRDKVMPNIIPAGGIAGGAKKLKDLLKKSGAGYSGSGDYKE